MHQSVSPANVDEGAKLSQAGDPTGADFAFVQFINDAFFDGFTGFGAGLALGEDQAAAFAIHFDHANVDFLADHLAPARFRGVAGHGSAARQADLRSGHEPAQTAHRNDQTTFVVANDLAVEGFFRFHQRVGIFPAHFLACAHVGKDNVPAGILGVDHKNRYFLADLYFG